MGSHFYGRIINLRVSNDKFKSLSQIGKIALFISTTLEKIYNEISNIHKNKILIFIIDDADQNYKYCKKFINKLGLELKVNEKKVLEAVKILLANPDDIEIFNKKAIYLYLREITGLNTKQVVNNLNKLRNRYATFKKKWNKGEF